MVSPVLSGRLLDEAELVGVDEGPHEVLDDLAATLDSSSCLPDRELAAARLAAIEDRRGRPSRTFSRLLFAAGRCRASACVRDDMRRTRFSKKPFNNDEHLGHVGLGV